MGLDLERPRIVRAVHDVLDANPRDARGVCAALGVDDLGGIARVLHDHDNNRCTTSGKYDTIQEPCLHELWDIASSLYDEFHP